MIFDLEQFKLDRKAAILSGKCDVVRSWAAKYGVSRVFKMTDEEILEFMSLTPIWD